MIFKSSLWSVFGNLGEKVFTILTYILVARQVDKNQLGLIVVVFLVYELLSYVSSLGIRENIVRKNLVSENLGGDNLSGKNLVGENLVGEHLVGTNLGDKNIVKLR